MADQRVAELERRVKEISEHAKAADQRAIASEQRAEASDQRAKAAIQRAALEAQARKDAERLNQLLQRENTKLQRAGRDQSLPPHLWQMSQMHQHVGRLIPLPVVAQSGSTSVPEARAIVESMGEQPTTRSRRSSSSSASSTKGQTSIEGKYYPLHVRPWTDFVATQKQVFSRLRESLGDRHVFPSSLQIQAEETTLEDSLPTAFLNTESFLNEQRTSVFLGTAVERPASKVLEQYFSAEGQEQAVFFDNLSAGVKKVVPASTSQSQDAFSISSPLRSLNVDSPTEVGSGLDRSQDPTQAVPETSPTGSQGQTRRKTQTRKTRPDCVVLMKDLASDVDDDAAKTRRLMVGEHKPCHALPPQELAANATLAEDILVRLAVAQKAKQKKKQEKLMPKNVDALNESKNKNIKKDADAFPEKHPYFAAALAQTYHYMLLSGLEYGYLGSGETLTLLRIPEADATTLLYHTCYFPGVPPDKLPQENNLPVYPTGLTKVEMPEVLAEDDMAALDEIAVSQVSALGLMAWDVPIRTPEWLSNAISRLAPFPSIPEHLLRRSSGIASPTRRRYSDSHDDDDDNDSDHGNDNSERRGRPRQLTRLQSNQERAPSPLRQVQGVARSPNTSYCTQACLLRLVRGQMLDPACPNYQEHRSAAAAAAAGEQNSLLHHPITPLTLRKLVRAQLRRHPEENCMPLFGQGSSRDSRGAIGCLLKITVSGYGYTFVAKAVERENASKLRHESRLYTALHRQQGVSIPVHLGLLRLAVPYPFMAEFTVLTHVLLLSYTGIALHFQGSQLAQLGQQLGRNLEQEIADTYAALEEWGVFDLDTKVCNATWCEETQRVMKIDFDHARLDRAVYAEKLQSVLAMEKAKTLRKRGLVEGGDTDEKDRGAAKRVRQEATT